MQWLSFKILLALTVVLAGCQVQKPVNSYPFYETTVDKLTPLKDIKGVLIMAYNHPSVPFYALVVGDRRFDLRFWIEIATAKDNPGQRPGLNNRGRCSG